MRLLHIALFVNWKYILKNCVCLEVTIRVAILNKCEAYIFPELLVQICLLETPHFIFNVRFTVKSDVSMFWSCVFAVKDFFVTYACLPPNNKFKHAYSKIKSLRDICSVLVS
jgi:hypothetical protein